VVVDVQNAIPFLSPLYCGRPVVVLVHHVHREQWGMLFGRRVARTGWWVESRLAPLVYRRAAYVTVSEATKAALVDLGVGADRIAVVHNGSPVDAEGVPGPVAKTPEPSVVFLGRLVPHKRVELLIAAARDLRAEFPSLRIRIVGQGAWDVHLHTTCAQANVQDLVSFEGFVDDASKRRILRESWVMALPSVMEGWGLAVVEGAVEGTPSVAFRVGGLQESIADGSTGLLADDYDGFVGALRAMLRSEELRARLGDAARRRAASFTWDGTAVGFAAALDDAVAAARIARESTPVPASVVEDAIVVPEAASVPTG
jgi:glycosyltransferase involved in cell wall biosynthesis